MEELVLGALDHAWPGQWKPVVPGLSAFLVESGTGMYVGYSDSRVILAAGALVDVPSNPATVRAISDLYPQVPLGGLHLGQTADPGSLSLLVVTKIAASWLQAGNEVSLQIMLDLVVNLPAIARNVAARLAPDIGGNRWIVDDSEGWHLVFMGHL